MRIQNKGIAKDTAKGKMKRNKAGPGTNGVKANTPSDVSKGGQERSKSEPVQEISEGDRKRLAAWLNSQDRAFSVMTVPMTRKRKRDTAAPLSVQDDLFEERLTVQYEVKPRDKWDSLRRYKKFTVASESIAVGDIILVNHDNPDLDSEIDVADQWKAKVLEVRALDSEHVYVRVAWLNRPEDLDSGRKAYHGRNELIPTNQLDVIDAMAVNGRLDVVHWNEAEEGNPAPEEDQFFWRQTYDQANTRTFSKLRQICIDTAPENPDEMALQCSHKDCRRRLHANCVAAKAIQAPAKHTSPQSKGSEPSPKKRARPKNTETAPPGSCPKAQGRAVNGKVTAEILIAGFPDGDDAVAPATATEVVITEADGEQYAEDLRCLFCDQLIEA